MLVKIEIDCETAGELESHLTEIIRTVKIRSRNILRRIDELLITLNEELNGKSN